ncbi:MAG: phage tail tape measure protein [Archaeoglobus sp.]|uniref:phage tail tape measure protein n=1 Tax=Archaeoglobus sp. TaxID=1872626 RepID=UPI001D3F0C90|nr:phage tail tape measure protein [Archaeoglobus sp.]MBO8180792.1 phage tail tape measure protein [Archaeoglobus sp.]
MANDEILKIIVAVKDDATKALKGITEELGGLKTAAMAAGAALGALVLKKSIEEFTDFQSALKQSVAIMGDVSREMEEKLAQKALDIANTMAVSQEEVARAYYYLASAGLSAKESLEAVTDVAKLAVAAHMDMAEATDIAVNTMKAFGLTVQDLARINDTLIATVTKSNTNLQQLGEAMKYVAPFAHQVGWSLEEVSAALGILANHGVKASQAGTYLRQAIAQLIDPTDSAKEAIERLGLTVEDLNPETHSLAEILQKLQDAGASTADIMQIFGVRAGSAIAILTQEGAPALRQFTEEIKNSGNITDEVRKKQEEAFGEQLKIFQNNLRSVAITIGSVVVPALNSMLQPILKLLQAFNSLPEPIKKTTGTVIALGSATMVVTGAIKALSGLMTLLGMGGVLSSVTGALGAVGGALTALAGAISLPAVAIGALIAAIVALIFNIGGFRDKVISALKWVAEKLYDFVTTWIEMWTKIYELLYEVLQKVWDIITSAVSKIVSKIKELGQQAWEGIKSGFSRIAEPVKEKFNEILAFIAGLPGQLKAKAIELGWAIVDGFKAGLSSLFAVIKDSLTNPVEEAVNTIKSWLGISSPSKVFEDIGRNIVEGYKRGIDTAKDLTPKLPLPTVEPPLITTPGIGLLPTATPAGGTITINVDLHGSVIREEADIDKLVTEIERRVARRLR